METDSKDHDAIKFPGAMLNFHERDLNGFTDDITAYHQLMLDIAAAQAASTTLVLNGAPVKNIYVDGGFGRNELFMYLLSLHFPQSEIYAASMPQATAIGAALAIHHAWNSATLAGKSYHPAKMAANAVQCRIVKRIVTYIFTK